MRLSAFKVNPLSYWGGDNNGLLQFRADGKTPLDGSGYYFVKETDCKNTHTVFDGAPSEWAKANGATHTLWVDCDNSTRPAILSKSRLFVMIDEDEGGPVWERWGIRLYND